jgi:hypothetical protein
VLRVTGFAGLAVFATFFAFTWAMPQWVEDFGADYLESEVIERVDTAIDALEPGSDATLAGALAAEIYRRNESLVAELKARAKEHARALLAASLDQVRDPDCACRRIVADWLRGDVATAIGSVANAAGLTALIHENYLRVVAELKREIRIFAGINALSFVLLIVISFAKPAAAKHLLFPGVLLLCATLFCAWLYVFSQDWLLTIIQGSYVGFAYAAYLSLAYAFLCDIGFNRGRVTTWLGNRFLDAAGSAATMTTC